MINIDKKTRQRIFAMYWGCDMIVPDTYDDYKYHVGQLCEMDEYQIGILDGNETSNHEDAQILVPPMEQITDAHADTLGYMTAESFNYHMRNKKWKLDQFEVDFLRAHGYATPCAGFSVDQLVEAGIFKIKTQ